MKYKTEYGTAVYAVDEDNVPVMLCNNRITDGIKLSISYLAQTCFSISILKGFWEPCIGDDVVNEGVLHKELFISRRNMGEAIALIHSELSEALEAHRTDDGYSHVGAKDDKLDRPGIEVEFADAIIRIMDIAYAYNLDIGGAVIDKLKYNIGRGHKHGKVY